MSDPAILFVKPDAISTNDKEALESVGVIVVEIEDPTAVKFIRAGTELQSSDLLGAAGTAILRSDFAQTAFGKAVAALLEARRHD